ncbi:unnamed protein product [Blepharisma stoltei]|uniref:Uncharacterized protein n=1 Tax=Blepharisma stoltei TaxID=1481888 RepID=A0AAU9JSS9_9CILI|nr:unnamed protein product [Blepharisma stoltei]
MNDTMDIEPQSTEVESQTISWSYSCYPPENPPILQVTWIPEVKKDLLLDAELKESEILSSTLASLAKFQKKRVKNYESMILTQTPKYFNTKSSVPLPAKKIEIYKAPLLMIEDDKTKPIYNQKTAAAAAAGKYNNTSDNNFGAFYEDYMAIDDLYNFKRKIDSEFVPCKRIKT